MSIELLFCIASALVAAAIGWNSGYARGRSVGWLEHYDECHARNMARRQRNGQFKAKEDKAL